MSGNFIRLKWKLIFIFTYLSMTALLVPEQLVQNGDFDYQLFVLPDNDTEWLINKSKNKMLHWRISNGTIQILRNTDI
ncbi:hypothetical protein R1flu_023791 [Riccia fluitans]|uniref:Uncharacterized protein n=1 Tax=Riccia fluitans TaxID=41844 RepID=A0ABD1XT47_9MARC